MAALFISYRRLDDAGEAGRLYDRLKKRFGDDVFMDVEGGIQPGEPFAEVIARRLRGCKAVIVVIGPRWSSATDAEGRRRLENPEDWVRIEIATALRHGIDVYPVLVDGASMPRSDELPEELAPLAGRQALAVRNDSWDFDVGNLIHALERVVPRRILRKWRMPAAVAVAALGIALALRLTMGAPDAGQASFLEVALHAVEADERGAVLAASRFDSPDGTYPDSILERVVDWIADTLHVEPSSPTDLARVVVDVPADLESSPYRVERIPAGPIEVQVWGVTETGKVRVPLTRGSLRTRTQPFTIEIGVPGFGTTAVEVIPGEALSDTLELAVSSGTVRIGVEEIDGYPGIGLSLTRVLASRPGLTAASPAALEAMRRTLEEARKAILDNPMVQTEIRESLGVDYLLRGSVVTPRPR